MKEATLASGMRVWSAQPEGPGPFPTAFILHERYGPVQHTFNIMERMAREGFAAFAPDLFHRYTGNRQAVEAAEERVELPDEHTLTDIDELMGHVRGLDYADDARVVIAGYCQTGRTPLVVASHRSYVSGALVLHGGIYPRDYAATETGEESVVGLTPRLSCPVFGAFGELDELIPLPNIWTFRQMLEEHGKSYDINIFSGAPHSWMNTTTPRAFERYRAEQTEDAWRAMLGFCREVVSGAWDREQLVFRFNSSIQPDQKFLP